jgi:hypothetical protein
MSRNPPTLGNQPASEMPVKLALAAELAKAIAPYLGNDKPSPNGPGFVRREIDLRELVEKSLHAAELLIAEYEAS